MAQAILQKGGAGSGSDDCTATINQVLEGVTAIVNDGSDEPQEGALPLESVLETNGGTIPLSSVLESDGGTMPYITDQTINLNCGDYITIEPGCHSGNSRVTANSLSSQTGVESGKSAITPSTVLNNSQGWVNGNRISGSMPNNGAVSPNKLSAGGSYTVPEGYHNGAGTVTAKTLASQTGVNTGKSAIKPEAVLNGYEGWVNGSRISGMLSINSITSFNCAQYMSGTNKVQVTFNITPRTGRPWGGLHVCGSKTGYPSGVNDGFIDDIRSVQGGVITLPGEVQEETDETWYFKAWDFYDYNTNGSTGPGAQYDQRQYGLSYTYSCTITRQPSRKIVIFPGNLSNDVSGSFTVPTTYTHMDVAVVACGGYTGATYSHEYERHISVSEIDTTYQVYGKAGGEGGEVKILSLSCSAGQAGLFSIGKAGQAPRATRTDSPNPYVRGYTSPYTKGTHGNDTTFTFNGTTTTCRAGNCGSAGKQGSGGSGRGGAAGGGAGSFDSWGTTGGNGADGTYFAPTDTYYGGGGCGIGSSYRHENGYQVIDTKIPGIPGNSGRTSNEFGHGGDARQGYSYSTALPDNPKPGAIIICFS